MRGRTNISGGGGFIDGQLEKYEIADGKTVTKGQFVEFEIEPTTKFFTGSPFYDKYAQVEKIEDGVFWFLYNPQSSWIVSVIDIKAGFVVKDAYVVTANNSYSSNMILQEDGKIIVFDYSTGYLKTLSYSEEKINVVSEYKIEGKENSAFIGMSKEIDKIILLFANFSSGRGLKNVSYTVLSIVDGLTTVLNESEVTTEVTVSEYTWKSCYVFSETKNNVINILEGYNHDVSLGFSYEENIVIHEKTLLTDSEKHAKIVSGSDCIIDSDISFDLNTDFILIYNMRNGFSKISEFELFDNNPLVGKTTSVSIQKISEGKIIIAQTFYDSNSYLYSYLWIYTANIDSTGSINVNKILKYENIIGSNYGAGGGAFFINGNDIYYVCYDGYDTRSCIVFGIEITDSGELQFKGSKKIKPYESIINGVANQSGKEGDTIEIYVPTIE